MGNIPAATAPAAEYFPQGVNDRKQCRTHYKEGKEHVTAILLSLNGTRMRKDELFEKVTKIGVSLDGMWKWYDDGKKHSTKPAVRRIDFPRSQTEHRDFIDGNEEKKQYGCKWLSTVKVQTSGIKIFWRITDHASQAVIRDQDIGMLAGGSAKLNTAAERRVTLRNHIRWGNRSPSPYISVGTDAQELHDNPRRLPHYLARAAKKKPADTVEWIQVSVNARIQEGHAMLHAIDVLQRYVGKGSFNEEFHRNEYLLPFHVPPEEIVWKWNWKHIKKWMDEHDCFGDMTKWLETIATPAYEAHEKARELGRTAKMRRRAVNRFLQQSDMCYAALIEKEL